MRINYKIPQTWNELTSWQLLRIGKLLSSNNKTSNKYFVGMLISILLMPKFSIGSVIKALFLFSQVPLSELQQYCVFITDKKNVLTKFPEKFKIKSKYIYGPSDRLANLTIEEFSYADGFFYNWAQNQNSTDLNRLVSVLYRVADKNPKAEDIRIPFNKITLAKQAELAQKIPLGYKYIIALAFQGSREKIYENYPVIFPKPIENSEAETNKKNPIYKPFTEVIRSLAMDETQILGPLQAVEKTDINSFFSVYQAAILRQRELEKI